MARAGRSSSRTDSMMLGGCLVLSLVAHGLPDRLRDPIAGGMRRSIIAPLVALQHGAELWRDAWLTHDAKQLARDTAALGAMQAASLEAENARLRKLLALGQQIRWGFVAAEALHARAVGEEYTVTLSAGSNAGVRRFSPVIAPEGLVGMVQAVDPTMSLAIMWAHPDFRVSAMTADGSAFGIAAAHLGSGQERYLLDLRGVPFRTAVRPGTLVVSSGLGGVYPRGIPIGTIIGEAKTSEGFVRTYLVRPAVLPADVSAVMVLQPQRAVAGVESVWASGRTAAADSARRDTLVRRDSLLRRDTLARRDTAQRRARAMRRDTLGRRDSLGRRLLLSRPDSAAAAALGVVGRDSTRTRRVRRDTVRGDSARQAGTRPLAAAGDSARRQPARRDSGRRDSARRDSTRLTAPPRVPGPPPAGRS